jgi:hypothetical protein
LWRDGFAAALAYLNGGIAWQRRSKAIRIGMCNAVGAQVLEIGSQSWEPCPLRYGYRRHSSPPDQYLASGAQGRSDIGEKAWNFLRLSQDGRPRLRIRWWQSRLRVRGRHFCITSIARALREIPRVLRKIVVVEQLQRNPVAGLMRSLTPNARTPDGFLLGRLERAWWA